MKKTESGAPGYHHGHKKPESGSPGYHHGNLRDALVDAAVEAIRENGPQGFSLRGLARNIGVSTAAPYRHFPSREAILAAVAEEGFRRLSESMAETLAETIADSMEADLDVTPSAESSSASSSPPHDWCVYQIEGSVQRAKPAPRSTTPPRSMPAPAVIRLMAIGRGYVRFAAANPAHFSIMFNRALIESPEDYPGLVAESQRAFQALTDAIHACRDAGEVVDESPRDLVVIAWSMVHGLSSLICSGQISGLGYGPDAIDALAEFAGKQLFSGIAKTPPA